MARKYHRPSLQERPLPKMRFALSTAKQIGKICGMVKWEVLDTPHPMLTICLSNIGTVTMFTGKERSQRKSEDRKVLVHGATNNIEAREKERQLYIHLTVLSTKLFLCKLCWKF